jgi:glutathione synthase
MNNKKINVGVVMDDINNINPEKDTTLELLLEAKKRSLNIIYFKQSGLYIKNGFAYGKGYEIEVFPSPKKYFEYTKSWEGELSKLDMLLMRKDPPFNMNYIYTTYILELAEKNGVKVINNPKSLRDINEKSYTAWIPDLTPPHIITNNINQIKSFLKQYKKIVIKPLDSMGGQSIFVIDEKDLNTNVIIEVMTKNNNRFIIAQKYIKEITKGDKRIILINGEPIKYSLVRIPKEGDTRGNLAMGSSKK